MNTLKLKKILIGTDHESIEDAIAADLTSAIPFIGGFTDFLRLLDSESRPQKALQVVDMITSPLPFSDLVTPTNTLVYLNKKGMLPFELEKIDEIMRKPLCNFNKLSLFKKR